jgi:hypothetical protein
VYYDTVSEWWLILFMRTSLIPDAATFRFMFASSNQSLTALTCCNGK